MMVGLVLNLDFFQPWQRTQQDVFNSLQTANRNCDMSERNTGLECL